MHCMHAYAHMLVQAQNNTCNQINMHVTVTMTLYYDMTQRGAKFKNDIQQST